MRRLILMVIIIAARTLAAEEKPMTAIEAGRMAVAASDDLRAEYATLALREGAWTLGFRSYLPNVSFAAGEDDRLSKTSSDSFSKSLSVMADQLIWDGGRIATARGLEAAEISLAKSVLDRKKRETAESAVSAYWAVLASREVSEIKKANLANLQEQRRILRVELAAGLARADDAAEADLSVGNAEIDFLDAEIAVKDAERSFANILAIDALPPFADRVDIDRRAVPLSERIIRTLTDAARAANPDIAAARLSIAKKEAEAKSASAAWSPTVKLTASARVSGDRYPLTRSSWNIGVNIDFSGPLLSGSASSGAGWEPPYDSSANASMKLQPLADPSSALSARSAAVALTLEREKYGRALALMGRKVSAAAERYALLDRRLSLARDSLNLARRKSALSLLGAEMGRTTRVDVMESQSEETMTRSALVRAATELVEGERELEKIIDLPPGGLAAFVRRESGRSEEL